ncbi:MAG: serine/threonine-protein kinase, partial [Planctomycetota bacterium]|nr:serine/threonine-protein kinase [Planctomycetota bacterium]
DRRLGRDGALKILPNESCTPEKLSRFKREIRITAHLDHPAIPPVFDAGTTADGEPFMLMKVIEGETLLEHIAALHKTKSVKLDYRPLLIILLKVADAISYAHNRGILHRDLKPENVMVGAFGEVMVMDWGIARDLRELEDSRLRGQLVSEANIDRGELAKAGMTEDGAVVGTPGYMAPEQIEGKVDERSDVFALGVLLTEILTNSIPVEGTDSVMLLLCTAAGQIRSPLEINPNVPPELDSLAQFALNRDPEKRPSSVEEFSQELRSFLADNEVSCHDYSLAERSNRWARRNPKVLLGILALSVLSIVSVLIWSYLSQIKQKNNLLAIQYQSEQEQRRIAEETARKIESAMSELTKAQDMARSGRDQEKVHQTVVRALRDGRRTLSFLMAAAEVYESANDPRRARSILNEAIARHPPAYAALFYLHRFESQRAKDPALLWTNSLKRLLAEAKRRGDENEFTDFSRGVQLAGQGQLEKALKCYESALEKTRRNAIIFNNRGVIYSKLGQSKLAVSDFNRAIELKPDYDLPYLNRGVARDRLGLKKEAIEDYTKAIACRSGSDLAHFNRGKAWSDLGEEEKAILDYDRSIKINPSYEAYYNRGNSYLNLQNLKKAVANYSLAIEVDSKRPNVYGNRGIVYSLLGKREEAKADLDRALKLNPNIYALHFPRAQVKQLMGDIAGAIADYEIFLEKSDAGEEVKREARRKLAELKKANK